MPPIPKDMHPEYNLERRLSIATAVTKTFGRNEDAVFVDAARYRDRHCFVAAVVRPHIPKQSKRLTRHKARSNGEGSGYCAGHTNAYYVINYSQTAVRNYANGRISPEALRILNKGKIHETDKCVQILWFPSHTPIGKPELNPDKLVHNVALGLTFQAAFEAATIRTDSSVAVWEWDDRLTKFCKITHHYQLQRREYPPPHHKLTPAQSVQ